MHLSSFESGSALHSVSKDNLEFTDEKAKVLMKTGTYNLTLDEFINQTKVVPKMLKIDTDGKELEILKRSSKIIGVYTIYCFGNAYYF